MTTITRDQMINALERARDERGEGFVYTEHYGGENACQYVVENEDGKAEAACIAGNALLRLGVPISVLKKMDVAAEGGASAVMDRRSVATILLNAGFDLTPKALLAASYAQAEQDSGRTWGQAVAEAIAVSKERDE